MEETEVRQTRKWITDVVVGCNFCPFAARVVNKAAINFAVGRDDDDADNLMILVREFERLDDHPEIATTLVLFPGLYEDFDDYLAFFDLAEQTLEGRKYEGIYQVASFHPQYLFEGSEEEDPANYTNRSPYPMIHILREDDITRALENFNQPEQIPDRNVEFARKKGLAHMISLFQASLVK